LAREAQLEFRRLLVLWIRRVGMGLCIIIEIIIIGFSAGVVGTA
jgi:hypothetical protein